MDVLIKGFWVLWERLWLLHAVQYSRDPALLPELHEAQKERHIAFCETYGAAHLRPKHHFCLHVPAQFQDRGYMLDTLACERRHQIFKACVTSKLTSFRNWDATVLAMMQQDEELDQDAAHQFWKLPVNDPGSKNASATCPWRTYEVKQPVVWTDRQRCGIVLFVDEVHGQVILTLQEYRREREIGAGMLCWRCEPRSLRTPVDAQQRGLLLPRYWLSIGDSLLTLG